MQDIRSSEPFVALWSLPIFAEGCLSFECTVSFKFSGAGGAGRDLRKKDESNISMLTSQLLAPGSKLMSRGPAPSSYRTSAVTFRRGGSESGRE